MRLASCGGGRLATATGVGASLLSVSVSRSLDPCRFENVNALFPSIYLESADAATNVKRVDTQLVEARRIRSKVSTATGRHASDLPIYTFTWMDYYAGEVTPWIKQSTRV